MRNKKVLIPVAIFGLMVSGGILYSTARASNNGQNPNISQQLSEKLGVDETQVNAALDQIRQERQAERQQEISANLDKAVADGVITADQKQALEDKQTEMQLDREQKRAEMQQWMRDNGIDHEKIREYMGAGKGFGGRGHGVRMMDTETN